MVVLAGLRDPCPVTRPRNDFVLLDMQPDRVGLHTRPRRPSLHYHAPYLRALIRLPPSALYLPFSVCPRPRPETPAANHAMKPSGTIL
jgi:hypothetical protein